MKGVSGHPLVRVEPAAVIFEDGNGHVFRARGKWRTFYLSVLAAAGAPINRRVVKRLRGWGDDELAIGRELARHLKSAQVRALGAPPLVSGRPTLEWALHPAYRTDAPETQIDTLGLIKEADERSLNGHDDLFNPVEFQNALKLFNAQFRFYEGHLPRSYALAKDVLDSTGHADLKAIAAVLTLRAGWRLPIRDARLDFLETVEDELLALPRTEMVSALIQRCGAFRALHEPPERWQETESRLIRQAYTLKRGIDLAGTAYALNYAALLARRLGHIDRGLAAICRALTMALAAADVYVMQIVLFNTGLLLSESPGLPGADHLAIEALRLVSHITRTHHIGDDSAQNELLIATMHLRAGRFDAAEQELLTARRLIDASDNLYDRAEWHSVAAQLAQHRPQAKVVGGIAANRHHLLAADLYAQASRPDLAEASRLKARRV